MSEPSEKPNAVAWLLLIYRVPREPTRLRAAVWRRLKALGAVYLQSSTAVLPESAGHERSLRALRREIAQMGGTAQVMRCEALAGGREVIATYNAARDEEYDEILDKCRDFLAEIDKETADAHFSYAELEENDEDLNKLTGWFDKIRARDMLGASHRTQVRAALDECATALARFAEHVYRAEDQD
jgi:hypothetical protein